MKKFYLSFLLIIVFILPITAQDFELPQPTILELAWHPSENLLAIADTEGARLIDTTTGEILRIFPVDSTPVYAIAWSPDGLRLATGGNEGELKIWDAMAGELLANLVGHPDMINTLAWNSDGSRLASSSVDFEGTLLRTWDMNTYQVIAEKIAGFMTRLLWSHNNLVLFAAQREIGAVSIDAQLSLGSSLTYNLSPNFSFDGIAIALHPSRNLIAVGSADGNIHLLDVDTEQILISLNAHSDFVTDLEWSSDGSFLTSVSTDGTVKTWDIVTGQALAHFEQENILYAVAVSPDGSQIAYGGENMGGIESSIPIILTPNRGNNKTI